MFDWCLKMEELLHLSGRLFRDVQLSELLQEHRVDVLGA